MKLDPRKALLQEALSLKGNHWIFELATGSGKSKIALEKIKSIYNKGNKILIVSPRKVHNETWSEEIRKWWPELKENWCWVTYNSFPKHAVGEWDFIIFDECHHITPRVFEGIEKCNIHHALFLSATISKGLKANLYVRFKGLKVLKANLRDVINEGILPDPKVYLIPLNLRNDFPTERIIKNPKATGTPIQASWKERWLYKNVKNIPVHIYCTEYQYLVDLNSQIEWWKKRFNHTRNEGVKAKWLKLCWDRLNWLSRKKDSIVGDILQHLKEYRTLTFCSNIEQTEMLGENCINSKNTEAKRILNDFNNSIIDHITACNMLNEGCNLYNCQIGIYANINSSDIIVKQRAGRLLRHPDPIIIIPYYKGTREEELVNKMLENYNPQLVRKIYSVNNIII